MREQIDDRLHIRFRALIDHREETTEGYHKSTRVERQVLYDQVWSQPMTLHRAPLFTRPPKPAKTRPFPNEHILIVRVAGAPSVGHTIAPPSFPLFATPRATAES